MCIRSEFNEAAVIAITDAVTINTPIAELAALLLTMPDKTFAHPLGFAGALVKHAVVDDFEFGDVARAVSPIARGYLRLRRRHGDLFAGTAHALPDLFPKKTGTRRQPPAAPAPIAAAPLPGGACHPVPPLSAPPTHNRSATMFNDNRRNSHAPTPITHSVKSLGSAFDGLIKDRAKRRKAAAKAAAAAPVAMPARFFAEVRTQAGKVKFRTERAYDTPELAAAAAFRDGPDWARECVTYTGLASHRR